jgi:hypothetical protein
MFAGGASVSWHFASVGPDVTDEVELHPAHTVIARAGKSANGYRPTLFARTAAHREGVLSIEAL